MKALIPSFLLLVPVLAFANNDLLAELAKEDQAQRSGQEIIRTDADRRDLVFAMLAAGEVQTPADQFNAGLVLQHTGLGFCDGKLVSHSPENYLLAHELFKEALKGGHKEAAHFVAASIDRYLGFTQGYQKYGTNRVINQETGDEELIPIDRSISDAERAKYGVPPLEELLSQYHEAARSE